MNTKTTKTAFSDNVTAFPLQTGNSETSLIPQTANHPSTSIEITPPSSEPKAPATPSVFSAASPDNPADLERNRIDSLARRQRADSFLHSITPAQQLQVYRWIFELETIGEVHARIIAPPPQGLGVSVSPNTLRRLRSCWRAQNDATFTESMLDTITDMELEGQLTQPARIQNAICHFLHEKAFDLARTKPGSEVLKDVLNGIQKLTELDLKRQKLQLERQKFLHKPAGPAPHNTTQHHRVDLNIVPPAPKTAAIITSEPAP